MVILLEFHFDSHTDEPLFCYQLTQKSSWFYNRFLHFEQITYGSSLVVTILI